MLQNLVVEPETDVEGKPIGFYCVAYCVYIREGGGWHICC
jgi:hypothetical protein